MTSEEIVARVRAATRDVFSTMLNLPLEEREPFQEVAQDPAESYDGVEAMVGIAGSWTGTGRICCSSMVACKLAGAMLMSEYQALNEEVLDAMAEIANMIFGNVKTHLEEQLGPLGLSLPTVIFGRNYRTRSVGVPSWEVIPFACEGEKFELRFCLVPTRSSASVPKAETLQAV